MTIQANTRVCAVASVQRDAQVAEAIRRTIAYADLFGQAITLPEIMRYLEIRADDDGVLLSLTRHNETLWHERDGLYCLPGRQALFAQTQQRLRYAQARWARARRWAAVMARLPFVRMIAVTGSLAMNNIAPDADMDYLIVTAPGRVWFTRLLLIAVVRLARLCHDELCPNYVLSAEALDVQEQNFFVARELAQMVPLFGFDVYQQMMRLNQWYLDFLPGAASPPPGPSEITCGAGAQKVKSVAEAWLRSPWGDRLERWEMENKIARLRKMPGAESPNVILNAEQCKGHFRGTQRSAASRFDRHAPHSNVF